MLPWKKNGFGKCTRGKIMTSAVENVALPGCVLSVIYTTPCDGAARIYTRSTTDVTLDQYIQTGHPRECHTI